MKKFALGFSACFGIITFSIIGYVGHLLYIAKPGFYVSKDALSVSVDRKKDIFAALIKLSDLSSSIGLEKHSALFLGSAGVLGVDAGLTKIESRIILTKAITLAKIYADQTGDINAFMESRFTLALSFKDYGEIQYAKEIVSESLAFAVSNDPQSYWIRNFEGLKKKL